MQESGENTAEISFFDILTSILDKGGIFLILILITSIVLVATVIYKFIHLNKAAILPDALLRIVSDFSREPSDEGAVELQSALKGNQSVLADLCKDVLSKQDRDKESIEKSVEIKARDSIVGLGSGLPIMEVIITIAPLMGLLGTASGLVSVFSDLDVEASERADLAKGISEALYTTIAGLAVAVPAVIAHSHFTRKIETKSAKLELVVSRFITSLVK